MHACVHVSCHALLELIIIAQVKEAAQELGYQPDAIFCLKVNQLREIFAVRWSVFLLGPAGCGKTAIWKTLMRAQQLAGEKTVYKPINPKVRFYLKLPYIYRMHRYIPYVLFETHMA